MDNEPLNYEKWVEEALRTVIKRALKETALNGLPEDHHFFITFFLLARAPYAYTPRTRNIALPLFS